MKWKLYVLALFYLPICLFAQRKEKPTLLVYGEGVEAFSAAVQSALSSVPTLWVTPQKIDAIWDINFEELARSEQSLAGGVWMKLLMDVAKHKSPNDSVAREVKKQFTAIQLSEATNALLAGLSKLTILENTTIEKIKLGKRGWQVLLSDRKRYTPYAIVDASQTQQLVRRTALEDRLREGKISAAVSNFSDFASQRTILAVGTDQGNVHQLLASELLEPVKNDFFTLKCLNGFESNSQNIALRMQYAQAIGGAAAYSAFFKKAADKIDVRKLQSELLTYRVRLLPTTDITSEHQHFKNLEKIFLTGIFSTENNHFQQDKQVSYAEIQPAMTQLFSRSQLWFLDNEGEWLSWKDAIELVKFVSTRGNEVNRQIEEGWKSRFGFGNEYDANRPITRGEFAVILDQFANPYAVSVTHDGEIRR